MEFLGAKIGLSDNQPVSKTRIWFLAAVLVLIAGFILDRKFGWLGVFYREPVAIPPMEERLRYPNTEAIVIGFDGPRVFAERIPSAKVGEDKLALPKNLEVFTDEKTVFAEMTSFGPVKISKDELMEGNIVWIYSRVRSLEETLREPVDPDLIVPFISFEESLKNPRERLKADFVVKVGGK